MKDNYNQSKKAIRKMKNNRNKEMRKLWINNMMMKIIQQFKKKRVV